MTYCLGEGAYSTIFQQFFFPHGFSAEALTRIHEDVEHLSETSTYLSPEKGYFCDHEDCLYKAYASKLGLNLLKRYYKVHLQYYHNGDVGFNAEKDLMGCSIYYSYWYCSRCLCKVRTSSQACRKWVCPFCHLHCEQIHIKARQKLIPTGMDC
jgi:hypothetical protein